MNWKIMSYIAFALIVFVAGWWIRDGRNIFTQRERIVTKDELFGTETVSYGKNYMLGLDIAGPVCGALAIAGAAGLYADRRKRKTLS